MSHYDQMRDLWAELEQQQQLTNLIMSAQACMPSTLGDAPVQPFVETQADGDWVNFTGGPQSRADAWGAHVETIGYAGYRREFVQRFLYPYRFYNLGLRYLHRLWGLKPSDGAPAQDKVLWLLDASWWINMMLISANVYPKFLSEALARRLSTFYTQENYVDQLAHLSYGPFARIESGFLFPRPYRIPFSSDPGTAVGNVNSVMTHSQRDAVQYSRGFRWIRQHPWWKTMVFPGAAAELPTARRLDPAGALGYEHAVVQHGFFHTTQDPDVKAGLFRQFEDAQRNWSRYRYAFDAFVPAWIEAMLQVPYWGLVRAGYEMWSGHYNIPAGMEIDLGEGVGQIEIGLSLGPGEPANLVPATNDEARRDKEAWERAETRGYMQSFFAAYLLTFQGLVQAAGGQITRTQYDALVAWHDFATYRYEEEKPWKTQVPLPQAMCRLYDRKGVMTGPFIAADTARLLFAEGRQKPTDPITGLPSLEQMGDIDLGSNPMQQDFARSSQIRQWEQSQAPNFATAQPSSAIEVPAPRVVGPPPLVEHDGSNAVGWTVAGAATVAALVAFTWSRR